MREWSQIDASHPELYVKGSGMNNRRTFLKAAALSATSAVVSARGRAEQAAQPQPTLTPNSIPVGILPQHFDVEPGIHNLENGYKGLKLNPVRLLPEVKTAAFRARMQDVDLTAEKEKQRQAEAMKKTFRRKALGLLKQDFDRAVKPTAKPSTGFRKAGRSAPQPKLRRKLRYDDPGI